MVKLVEMTQVERQRFFRAALAPLEAAERRGDKADALPTTKALGQTGKAVGHTQAGPEAARRGPPAPLRRRLAAQLDRSRGLGDQRYEHRSAGHVGSFRVGKRTVTLTIPKPAIGAAVCMVVEWSPTVPQRLSGAICASIAMPRWPVWPSWCLKLG
jgi:hypothetical protein